MDVPAFDLAAAGLVDLVTKHLKKGDRIRLVGLGILQVRKRAARMGRNPATGEAIKIEASKKVAFRASKELKPSDLSVGKYGWATWTLFRRPKPFFLATRLSRTRRVRTIGAVLRRWS
jgi:nucleoid DNA-binding protein